MAFAAAAANGLSLRSLTAERDEATDLTGAWKLNKDVSDDPARVMETLQGGRHGGSGGGGHRPPGGFGGHGPGMHGGGSRGGMDPEEMRVRMNRALEPTGRLTITQTDGSITIAGSDGRSQTLTTNNRKQKLPLDNQTVEVRTKWNDGHLLKETSLGDGMRLTETYSLVSEPRQLHVAVKLDGSHLPRPVTLRRVYDAANPR